MRIVVCVDDKSITNDSTTKDLILKISSEQNNGLSIVDGKLVATKGHDGEDGSDGTTNTSGNGIVGNIHQKLGVLKCNTSCTSRIDPVEGDINGRINLQSAVVDKILNSVTP